MERHTLLVEIMFPTLKQRNVIQAHNIHSIGELLSEILNLNGPDIATSPVLYQTVQKCLAIFDAFTEEEMIQEISIKCKMSLHLFIHTHDKFTRTLIDQSIQGLLCDRASKFLVQTCIATLRQIAQRDAVLVSDYGSECLLRITQDGDGTDATSGLKNLFGLEGFLLYTKDRLQVQTNDIEEIIMLILNATSQSKLVFWVKLCLYVLTGAKKDDAALDVIDEEDEDDEGTFGVEVSTKKKSETRSYWATRWILVKAIRKILSDCRESPISEAHFSLKKAFALQKLSGATQILALHLNDIIKLVFMAATDEHFDVRYIGLEVLEEVIEYFKHAYEPELENVFLLEQYQAQVAAALSPAFGAKKIEQRTLAINTESSTPPHIVATACKVASTWLSSGVCSSLNDTQRVYRLLVSSLDRIRYEKQFASQGYSEISRLKQILAVLKAWAVIYMVSLEKSTVGKTLNELINPEMTSLIPLWVDIIRISTILDFSNENIAYVKIKSGMLNSLFKKLHIDRSEILPELLLSAWPKIAIAVSNCGQVNRKIKNLAVYFGIQRLSQVSSTVPIELVNDMIQVLETVDFEIFETDDEFIDLCMCFERLVITFDDDTSHLLILKSLNKILVKVLSNRSKFSQKCLESVLALSTRILIRKIPSINPRISTRLLSQDGFASPDKKVENFAPYLHIYPTILALSRKISATLIQSVAMIVFQIFLDCSDHVDMQTWKSAFIFADLDTHPDLALTIMESIPTNLFKDILLLMFTTMKNPVILRNYVKDWLEEVLTTESGKMKESVKMIESIFEKIPTMRLLFLEKLEKLKMFEEVAKIFDDHGDLLGGYINDRGEKLEKGIITAITKRHTQALKQLISQNDTLKKIVESALKSGNDDLCQYFFENYQIMTL